jgi:hypothetical protein
MVPNISFAGGSGLAHLPSFVFYIPFLLLVVFLTGAFYFIFWLITYKQRPTRKKWYQQRDKISEALSAKEFKMIFSDMETGIILYKKGKQRIEINKHQNQWFIKGEKQDLQDKGVFKAYKKSDELIQALLKYLTKT